MPGPRSNVSDKAFVALLDEAIVTIPLGQGQLIDLPSQTLIRPARHLQYQGSQYTDGIIRPPTSAVIIRRGDWFCSDCTSLSLARPCFCGQQHFCQGLMRVAREFWLVLNFSWLCRYCNLSTYQKKVGLCPVRRRGGGGADNYPKSLLPRCRSASWRLAFLASRGLSCYRTIFVNHVKTPRGRVPGYAHSYLSFKYRRCRARVVLVDEWPSIKSKLGGGRGRSPRVFVFFWGFFSSSLIQPYIVGTQVGRTS